MKRSGRHMKGSGRQASWEPDHKHPPWETNEKNWETNERKWETSRPGTRPDHPAPRRPFFKALRTPNSKLFGEKTCFFEQTVLDTVSIFWCDLFLDVGRFFFVMSHLSHLGPLCVSCWQLTLRATLAEKDAASPCETTQKDDCTVGAFSKHTVAQVWEFVGREMISLEPCGST